VKKNRIIVGISGASGIPLAVEFLKTLQACPDWETHLVISAAGEVTLRVETLYSLEQVKAMADYFYDCGNLAAAISSGTFLVNGMVIVPCSMKTLAGITSGYSDNLLLRAADVTLKERRKLVLVTREAPLSLIHLRNMINVTEAGATILPPILSYYNRPQTIDQMTRHVVGKILDQFGIHMDDLVRWGTLDETD